MSVDSSNIVRIDVANVFNECARHTAHFSESVDDGATIDALAIREDTYDDIYDFFMEGCAKIADACNYVTTSDESGLDALTRLQPNAADELSVIEAQEYEKQTGEAMDPDQKTIVIFDIPGLSEQTKNTIVQQYIKETLVHYVLYKWYFIKRLYQDSEMQKQKYEEGLGKCRFNSITNTKRKKVRRPNRFY